MENFKEIAEKCLKGELQGIFILADDTRLISDRVGKSPIKGHFHFDCIDGIFDKFGFCKGFYDRKNIPEYNIINFIPYKDMETKEIKIEVPEGYEIDKENSSFERIVFKPKERKYPESWEEYCKNTLKKGYYISTASVVEGVELKALNLHPISDKNILPTEEIAKKFLAYMQLISLRHKWIHIWSQERGMEKDWEPDWDTNENKACIACYHDEPGVESWQSITFSLSFPTFELADKFLQCFRDLLISAKGLY